MPNQPIGPEAPPLRCGFPVQQEHVGRSVRLARLDRSHAPDLWSAAKGGTESWTYLGYGPFGSFADLERHVVALQSLDKQPFFAVVTPDGKARGWLSYCDLEPQNAALEIGSIWFSPGLQRTRAATEAIFLLLDHAFSISFHRVAWRCNALNAPSLSAAYRLGFVFEGRWRKAQIVKDRWRDTDWFSQLSEDWPINRTRFERWLDDANFDEAGRQRSPLR